MAKYNFKPLLDKQMTRKEFIVFGAVAIASLFSIIGVVSELLSHADGPYTTSEAEGGALDGGAAKFTDNNASGGEAVRFNGASNTNTFTPSSAILANPEQGFYFYTETHYQSDNSDYEPLSQSQLISNRTGTYTENGLSFGPSSLVHRYFYMEKYVNGSSIESQYLALIASDLAIIRSSGSKVVIRFAYNSNENGSQPYNDSPSPSAVINHINQLYPTLNQYADVITAVEAGFIGVWGEWYYTDNFTTGSNMNNLSSADWTNRSNVLNALVNNLDSRIFVLVRYVGIKQNIYGFSPSSSNNRIGFHNDAFEASSDDYGTYDTFSSQSISQNQAYLAAQPPLPQTGESTNYNSPQSDWGQASADLAKYHWSSLNSAYYPATLQAWGQNNVNTVSQKLGYRLELLSASLSSSGNSHTITINLQNTGYSPPFRNRPVNIILNNANNSFVTAINNVDIRSWTPNQTITISATVSSPSASGTYSVYLSLPDPSSNLSSIPAYSIQMANNNVWDSALGANNLGLSILV